MNHNGSEANLMQYLRAAFAALNKSVKYRSRIIFRDFYIVQPPLVVVCDKQQRSSSFAFLSIPFNASKTITLLSRSIIDIVVAFFTTPHSGSGFSSLSYPVLLALTISSEPLRLLSLSQTVQKKNSYQPIRQPASWRPKTEHFETRLLPVSVGSPRVTLSLAKISIRMRLSPGHPFR